MPAELGAQDYVVLDAEGALRRRRRSTRSRRCSAPRPPWSRCRTACPGGTSTDSGGPLEGTRSKRSIPAARSGSASGRSARSAASSIRRPRSRRRASIRHVEGDRFSLGEPSGEKSERVVRARRGADRRRAAGAGPHRHPERDLGQALGQPLLQPDLGADRQHARRDRRRSRHARGGPRDDGRGAGDRRDARRPLPDRRRPAHRRRRRASARTRPRCSRTSSAAGRWRSTRWSPPCRSSAG